METVKNTGGLELMAAFQFKMNTLIGLLSQISR